MGCAYGRTTGIQGQDVSKAPEYYAVGAPSCHSGNLNCILPDYDDATAFYQCVGGCNVAVKQYCASCLHFDFWTQRCEWPGETRPHPPAPALCSSLPPTTPGPTTKPPTKPPTNPPTNPPTRPPTSTAAVNDDLCD